MEICYVEEPVSDYIRAAVSAILSIHDKVWQRLWTDHILSDFQGNSCTSVFEFSFFKDL